MSYVGVHTVRQLIQFICWLCVETGVYVIYTVTLYAIRPITVVSFLLLCVVAL
jgi:hypothetical protein